MSYLLIFLAGGAGALLRFWVDGVISSRWKGSIPLATFFINASGSFVLGLLTGLLSSWTGSTAGEDSFVITENIALVAGAGLLGGYTTFSTAMIEAVRTPGAVRRAVLLGGQAGTCLLCAAAGLALAL